MLGYQEHFSFSFCAVSLVTCENAVMKISLWEAQLRLYKHTHQCLTWYKYYWMRQQWSGFKQKAQFPLVMRTHTRTHLTILVSVRYCYLHLLVVK